MPVLSENGLTRQYIEEQLDMAQRNLRRVELEAEQYQATIEALTQELATLPPIPRKDTVFHRLRKF